MKYRVICDEAHFPTYFRTKREAKEFADTFKNATIERRIAGRWYK